MSVDQVARGLSAGVLAALQGSVISYQSQAAGLAATPVNGYFKIPTSVPGGLTYETLYQNQGGSAVVIAAQPSTTQTNDLITTEQAADILAAIDAITADPTNAETSVFIPSTLFGYTGTSQNAAVSTYGPSRGPCWSMPSGIESYLGCTIRLPSHWNTAFADFVYTNDVASTGNISFAAGIYSWGAGENTNGTPTTSGRVFAASTNLEYADVVASAGTFPVDPTRFSALRVAREGQSASDTLPNAINFVGLQLRKNS